MKDQETIQKFVELRAQGLSYARIAAQLQVARRTLINWSRQYQFDIHNLRAIEWESFADSVVTSRQERLKAIHDRLRRIEQELESRDLAAVPTAQLETMAERLRRRLDREAGAMTFSAPHTAFSDDELSEQVQDWHP